MNRRELIQQAAGVTAAGFAGPLAAVLPTAAEPLVEWQLPGDPPKGVGPLCIEKWTMVACRNRTAAVWSVELTELELDAIGRGDVLPWDVRPEALIYEDRGAWPDILPPELIIAVERELGELG